MQWVALWAHMTSGNSNCFSDPSDSPFALQLPAGLWKGTMKEPTVVNHGRLLHNSLNRYHAEFFPEVSTHTA